MSVGRLIKGYLAVIASAVIYGCMPLMAKHIYADGVTPLTLVFLRNFLALPVVAVMALVQVRSLRISPKLLSRVSLSGLLGSCITPILMYVSYQYIASGTTTVFHFIYPAIVVLIGVLLKEERLKWGNVIGVALCFIGVCLFYSPDGTLDWRGTVPAIASGFTYAAYVVLLAHSDAKKIPSFLFAFYVALTCSVAMFIVCIATGQLVLPQTAAGWGWAFLFSIGITCGAVVLFQIGTFMIGGQQASILSALEPLTSVIVGIAVLGEPSGLRTWLGSACVIAATVVIGIYNFKKAQRRK